jgi:hypothetical protein
MTHQEGIAHCITAILSLNDNVIIAFRRGNPFDKLLRSYDEFNAHGEPLYRNTRAVKHYKMSVRAFQSGLSGKELYGEHRIPLNVIIKRLLDSDRTYNSILEILRSNEVILITDEERKYLDESITKGGCGLRSKMPEDGRCRLEVGMIEIAPETLQNSL